MHSSKEASCPCSFSNSVTPSIVQLIDDAAIEADVIDVDSVEDSTNDQTEDVGALTETEAEDREEENNFHVNATAATVPRRKMLRTEYTGVLR